MSKHLGSGTSMRCPRGMTLKGGKCVSKGSKK